MVGQYSMVFLQLKREKKLWMTKLIVNLVPANGLCRNLVGDTSTLPTVTGMAGAVLGDGELLLTSSEDVGCFFYLFRTPAQWHRFMGFAREVPPEGLPAGYSGTGWHLVSRVLPMGFINSGNCSACAPPCHPTSIRRRAAVGRPTARDSS